MTDSPPLNPFEAPQAPDPSRSRSGGYTTGGQIDIGQCIEGGWHACWRNFAPWLAVMLLMGLLSILSIVTIIGAVVVWPVLIWGYITFTLRAVDGHAEVGEFFSGFGIFAAALVPMLGVTFLGAMVSLPQQILQMMPGLLAGSGEMALAGLTIVGYLGGMVYYAAVVARFQFAGFFAVDQGLGAVDAMRASWDATADQKLMVFLLILVTGMVAVAGMFALCVGVVPGAMIAQGAQAVAYRQLTSGGSREDSALLDAPASAF